MSADKSDAAEAHQPPESSQDAATSHSSSFKFTDSDGNPLDASYYYRLRFADGTELGMMTADEATQRATPVPPNRGLTVQLDLKVASMVLDEYNIKAYPTWSYGGGGRCTYLCFDSQDINLEWWNDSSKEPERPYIKIAGVANRCYMYVKGSKQESQVFGLQLTSLGTIVPDYWGAALEFQFVRVPNLLKST